MIAARFEKITPEGLTRTVLPDFTAPTPGLEYPHQLDPLSTAEDQPASMRDLKQLEARIMMLETRLDYLENGGP